MLFNSFSFIFLVLATYLLYYTRPFKKYQVPILIAASFTFYAFNSPTLLLLLIFSVATNALTSWLISSYENFQQRKLYALIGVVINLAVLIFFKYAGLFAGLLLPRDTSLFEFLNTIPLPIGISFFTFQGISLVVDTYRSKSLTKFQNKLPFHISQHGLNVTLFISFFPQLVAGPIVKAQDFFPQIKEKYSNEIDWDKVIKCLILGYFLKCVVADNLNDYTFRIAYPHFEIKSTVTLIVLLYGFSMQIFADFAGYSLIAIGVAGLFGYQLKQNFNFPYISSSYSEFWRRWHISLSSFLKEYLYFSLGGNRKGKIRTYINLLVTMALGGLWHGAAWSFVVWGIFHGFLLAIERFLQDIFKLKFRTLIKPFKVFLVFNSISVAWLLFILPEFNQALLYLKAIFTNTGLMPDYNIITYTIIYAIPVIIYHILYMIYEERVCVNIFRYSYVLYGLLLFLIITNSGTTQEFIYFQF
ncbi:MAG: MBOAT family O-acyltransferase [Cyclobacteriaceae bacterium]